MATEKFFHKSVHRTNLRPKRALILTLNGIMVLGERKRDGMFKRRHRRIIGGTNGAIVVFRNFKLIGSLYTLHKSEKALALSTEFGAMENIASLCFNRASK